MRRLTRYSLRSLLVLITISCVVLGWYTTVAREYREEREALAHLEQTHGMIGVEVDGQRDARLHPWCLTGVFGHATKNRISPLHVHRIMGGYGDKFLRVTEIGLRGDIFGVDERVGWDVIEQLATFRHLRHVTLSGPQDDSVRKRIVTLLPNAQVEFQYWGKESGTEAHREWDEAYPIPKGISITAPDEHRKPRDSDRGVDCEDPFDFS